MSEISEQIKLKAPLSSFPDKAFELHKLSAPTQALLTQIFRYNEAAKNGEWSTCEQILADYPDLDRCRVSTTDFNKIVDEIIAIEEYYKAEMDNYFAELSDFIALCKQQAVGLNDNVVSDQTSYSSSKIESMFSDVDTEINLLRNRADRAVQTIEKVIPVSDWQGDAAPYTYTMELTETELPKNTSPIVGINTSVIETASDDKLMNKSYGFISKCVEVENGIQFICLAKKPVSNIPIIIKGV